MTAAKTTRRGRKPNFRTVKDPGPFVSEWWRQRAILEKELEQVAAIAEEMNALQSQARTRFDLELPFVSRTGQIQQAPQSGTSVASNGNSATTSSEEWEPPTQQRRAAAPLPEQGVSSNQSGIEITTAPIAVDSGGQGDLRAAGASIFEGLRRSIGA